MKLARSSGLVLVVAMAASSAIAQEENVSFEVQGKDKVLGTLRPADEREAILGRLAAGTTLKASVKSTSKTGPIPAIDVFFNGDPVTGGASVVKGRGSSLKPPLKVSQTGLYRVVIRGDNVKDGDYSASVSWAPQKAFKGTGISPVDNSFAFSAPANSLVTVTLSANRSGFVPHLIDLRHADGTPVVTFTGGGKATRVLVPATDDYRVNFQSDGTDGAWKILVTIAPPKVRNHSVDIRDTALAGAFSGGPVVVGAIINPSGGTLSVAQGSPIDGSSVTIPPDGLGSPTGVFIAEAHVYTVDDGVHPAGPAVEFGPSGTVFPQGKAASVTIPFDPNAFPGGTESLVIYVKDQNGDIQPVPPPYVFEGGNVTFNTSHFSTFMATSPERGIPSDFYDVFQIMGGPGRDLAGFVGVGEGYAYFNDGFAIATDIRGVSFFAGNIEVQPTAFSDGKSYLLEGNAELAGDSTIVLKDGELGTEIGRVRRGLRDDFMILEHQSVQQTGVTVIFRPAHVRPTANTLAGNWHAMLWEFKAEGGKAGELTVPLFCVANSGTATIAPDGKTTFRYTNRVRRFTDFPGGVWNRDSGGAAVTTGDISIDSEVGVQLRFPGDNPPVQLHAECDGDVLVGRMSGVDRGEGFAAAQVALLVLVRQSSNASSASFVGSHFEVAGGLDLDRDPPSPVLEELGARWHGETGDVDIFANRTTSANLFICTSGFTEASQGTADFESHSFLVPNTKFTLTSSGLFTVPAGAIRGAAVRSGGLLIYLQTDDLTTAMGFVPQFTTGFSTKK